ncbi:hypothetical protein AALD26_15075 [Clostridium sporogenes]|uniref:hypothetical protein n=1 Tax=Clostridium sporogenes TaxID=1509 RepID=UPI0020A080C9|nr:hypothetical protein [Clostridium sporogenes]
MQIIKIGSISLDVNNIYYVDPVKGEDETGKINNKTLPYKDINTCIKMAQDNDCIYALGGTHKISNSNAAYGIGGVVDYKKALTFIGVPNKTIFKCDGINDNKCRDHHVICTKNIDTKIIDIIFDISFGSRTLNYSTALCGYESVSVRGKIYNCVFFIDGIPSMIYDNNNSSDILFKNCLFINKNSKNFINSFTNANNIKIEDCGFNTLLPPDCNKINCKENVIVKNAYNINDEIGVYYGLYKWSTLYYLLKQNSNYYTLKCEFYKKDIYESIRELEGKEILTQKDFKIYGIDDLNLLTKTIDTQVINGVDKGNLGNGGLFEISFSNDFMSINEVK